jgi:hypothetical protein
MVVAFIAIPLAFTAHAESLAEGMFPGSGEAFSINLGTHVASAPIVTTEAADMICNAASVIPGSIVHVCEVDEFDFFSLCNSYQLTRVE